MASNHRGSRRASEDARVVSRDQLRTTLPPRYDYFFLIPYFALRLSRFFSFAART